MPRGGKRPGAGAPKGNLNALKTGGRSVRLKAVLSALAQMPELQEFMLEVRRKQLAHQKRAARLIRGALLQLLRDLTTRPDSSGNTDNQIIAYLLASQALAGKDEKTFRVNQSRYKQPKK